MNIDLNTLSLPQLLDLQKQLPAIIESKRREDRKEAMAELTRIAAERGFSLDELLNDAKPSNAGKRATVEAKYANPANRAETWTGRGRRPQWVVAHLENGGSMDDVAI